LFYLFPATGDRFTVSSVKQAWCGGIHLPDGQTLFFGQFEDLIQAASCSFSAFSLGPEDQIYFSASFVESPDFDDPEKTVYFLGEPGIEEVDQDKIVTKTGVTAIGKLSFTAEQ
jgi:hypothetical protein